MPSEKTYQVGATLDDYDANIAIGDIDVTKDGVSVKASISISITNKNNETIANISTMEEDVFTITYLVNYESFATTIKRTIKVVK